MGNVLPPRINSSSGCELIRSFTALQQAVYSFQASKYDISLQSARYPVLRCNKCYSVNRRSAKTFFSRAVKSAQSHFTLTEREREREKERYKSQIFSQLDTLCMPRPRADKPANRPVLTRHASN